MSALYTDHDTWDIQFQDTPSGLQLRFTTTLEEAAVQGIRQRIQTWKGEWFLDIRVGVPYIDQVFIKKPNLVLLESMFRSIILQVPEIKAVPSVKMVIDSATREASVVWKAVLTNNQEISSADYRAFILGDL